MNKSRGKKKANKINYSKGVFLKLLLHIKSSASYNDMIALGQFCNQALFSPRSCNQGCILLKDCNLGRSKINGYRKAS